MDKIPILIDRYTLVYVQFGGLVSSIPEDLAEGFNCIGPILGVTLKNPSKYQLCTDGVQRSPVSTIKVVAGGGGPEFELDSEVPLKIGLNILKISIAVIPLFDTGY